MFHKHDLINISESEIHTLRFHYCLAMMMRDLWDLKIKKVNQITKKYYCYDYGGYVSLRFPLDMRRKDLPRKLRLKNHKP